ncbi:MAG: tetratricopeptide repeat protein [Prevotellaceae bacterium]|nr:tetratricopeptide repeat protein [Prevotellaceae bacterium]
MKILIWVFCLSCCFTALNVNLYAQQKDSRTVKKFIREGNKNYIDSAYESAEILYKDALDENPRSLVARFNLGNSLFKQDKFDEAIDVYDKLSKDENTNYNIGNAYLKKEEYEKAIEAYKETLRKNPSDMEAKSNLAYAKKKLQQQEQNKDNQDNKDNKENQDSKDNKDKSGDSKNQSQKQQPEMSKEEANYILNAVEANEKKTREKVGKLNAAKAAKNQPEKNW